MRSALVYLSILLSVTSCSRYQYYSLASDETPVDTTHRFVTENDTCRVSYDFSGANGQLSIFIYNKTDQPLQVD